MKISVIVPNYNHCASLGKNVEGIERQTYANWELIIVDDGSDDGSRSLIQSCIERDSRIRGIFLPQNRGAMVAIQVAYGVITGTLIYGSAADDYVSNPGFFEMAVSALSKQPGAAGFFGRAVVVDPATDKELWTMGSSPSVGFLAPRESMHAFLTSRLFVPGACSVWRRSAFEKVGGFDKELGPQTDYFVNHALPALGGVVFTDKVFAVVRASADSYSASVNDSEFFRRHALIERKLLALGLSYSVQPSWLRAWRENIINARLGVTRQTKFISAIRSFYSEIEPWELKSLSLRFHDCKRRLLDDCDAIEREVAEKDREARRIFDEVAGTLPMVAAHDIETDEEMDQTRLGLVRRAVRRLRRLVSR